MKSDLSNKNIYSSLLIRSLSVQGSIISPRIQVLSVLYLPDSPSLVIGFLFLCLWPHVPKLAAAISGITSTLKMEGKGMSFPSIICAFY